MTATTEETWLDDPTSVLSVFRAVAEHAEEFQVRMPIVNNKAAKRAAAAEARRAKAAADERERTERMTLEELRAYIAAIPGDFTALHYELLARLHAEDKVVTTASDAALASLRRTTVGALQAEAASGYAAGLPPGFEGGCSVCLEDFVEPSAAVAVLPACGHCFHDNCIGEYLGAFGKTCPLCNALV